MAIAQRRALRHPKNFVTRVVGSAVRFQGMGEDGK